jgi:hypothetical protein
MVLSVFDTYPSNQNLKQIVIVCFAFFFIANISVNYAFIASGYPVSFTESQLSFSGEEIKSHYAMMTDEQITLYLYAQIVDYVFIISYVLLIFYLGIYLGRLLSEHKRLKTTSYLIAIAGIVAGGCDMIENAFILLMIKNHGTFPNIYAIAHSYLALVKFTLMGVSLVGFIVLGMLYLLRYRPKKFQHRNKSTT